jgi:mannosyl-oligosaccharide alpha-1,2-mannosidase
MFNRGVHWVRNHFIVGPQDRVNLFEVTIRAVGGLLGAFSLAPEHTILRDKARDLVDACLFAFNTPTSLPMGLVSLHSQQAHEQYGASTIAEVGTLQLEYLTLARLTLNGIYRDKVNGATATIAALGRPLYTQFISPRTGQTTDTTITFGARVDSLYEYVNMHISRYNTHIHHHLTFFFF